MAAFKMRLSAEFYKPKFFLRRKILLYYIGYYIKVQSFLRPSVVGSSSFYSSGGLYVTWSVLHIVIEILNNVSYKSIKLSFFVKLTPHFIKRSVKWFKLGMLKIYQKRENGVFGFKICQSCKVCPIRRVLCIEIYWTNRISSNFYDIRIRKKPLLMTSGK